MTVLSVAQRVAPFIGIEVPSAVAASTEREHIELKEAMSWVSDRLVGGHDWQALRLKETITGDGTTEDWDLPTYYKRMLKFAQVWSSSYEAPLTHVIDTDQWLGYDIRSYDFIINAWTIYGNQMHIKPALASGVTAQYFYIDRRDIVAADGISYREEIQLDTDSFRLDENLIALGTIYRWKQQKKQDYAEELVDFEEEKARLIGDDIGARTLKVGRQFTPSDARVAYPRSITP